MGEGARGCWKRLVVIVLRRQRDEVFAWLRRDLSVFVRLTLASGIGSRSLPLLLPLATLKEFLHLTP